MLTRVENEVGRVGKAMQLTVPKILSAHIDRAKIYNKNNSSFY